MGFVQTIAIRTSGIDAVEDLLDDWHTNQAGVAPGYRHSRVLADRDDSGRYMIIVDFESAELAAENNDRPETAAWAEALSTMIEGDAEFVQYDVVHHTG